LLGGGAVLVVAGQVISTVTILVLKIVFWHVREQWGYFDTHFLRAADAIDHPNMQNFFRTSNPPGAGILSDGSEFDRRIALLYLGQLAILNLGNPRAEEIQGWVRRRWHAANAYFGASMAAVLGAGTGWALTHRCLPFLLFVTAVTAIFPGILGLIYRREVIRMVEFVINNPVPPQPATAAQ
jgi:hypothetical protein